MPEVPPVVLSIAGFDPSSGAGVTADVKTGAAHGCYVVTCITAQTVQSTTGVKRVIPNDANLIGDTLEALASDLDIAAVHIGMLGSGDVTDAVVQFLKKRPGQENIVLDPILKSSSGADLLDLRGVGLLQKELIPICDVITPNAAEAAALTGLKVDDVVGMRAAAENLHEAGAKATVITGGDLKQAIDLLSFTSRKGIQQEVFRGPKLASKATHGTGCAFSTTMACHLAMGRGLAEATLLAKVFVSAAIAAAYPLGNGVGPINHFYRMSEPKRSQLALETEKHHE